LIFQKEVFLSNDYSKTQALRNQASSIAIKRLISNNTLVSGKKKNSIIIFLPVAAPRQLDPVDHIFDIFVCFDRYNIHLWMFSGKYSKDFIRECLADRFHSCEIK